MKKKVLSTVLLSTVLLSNVGTITSVAAESSSIANAKGSVTVEQGEVKPPNPTPDPGNPTGPADPGDGVDPENPEQPTMPDIDGNHNGGNPGNGFTPGSPNGALTLIGTSNLNFGKIKTSAQNWRKNASAATVWVPGQNDLNPDGTIKADATYTAKSVGNYVQFGDVRSNYNGYELTAELTQPFTIEGGDPTKPADTLENASIDYVGGILTHALAADNTQTHPNLIKSSMELTYTHATGSEPAAGNLETVVQLDSIPISDTVPAVGKGVYSVEYGQTGNVEQKFIVDGVKSTTDTTGSSVFLKVPAKTAQNMKPGNYEAIVTWTLTGEAP